MKLSIIIANVVILSCSHLHAQESKAPPSNAGKMERIEYDMKRLNAPLPLTEEQATGRKLFAQKCSVCHTSITGEGTRGPQLNKDILAAIGDEGFRKKTLYGSDLMPGWQYVLEPAQIDSIIAYIKTVKKVAKKPVTKPGNTAEKKDPDA